VIKRHHNDQQPHGDQVFAPSTKGKAIKTTQTHSCGRSLGSTTPDVIGGFARAHGKCAADSIVQALLLRCASGQRKYQMFPGSQEVGVASETDFCVRHAVGAEVAELNSGIASGWVQIYRVNAKDGRQTVLHEALGSVLPS
jgi:hypothetical protein